MSGNSESDSRKKVVLAACQCARLALKYVKSGEERPLKAIEITEAWTRGEGNITLSDVREAADAADRKKTLKKCADIVRGFYPHAPEALKQREG